MAAIRTSATLPALRLIAAARFVASVLVPPVVRKLVPVLDELLAFSVNVVPPVTVTVTLPLVPTVPLKVPVTCARVYPVEMLIGNTTKSAVQLALAVTSKLYLAGYIPTLTLPPPRDTLQSRWSVPGELF